MTLHRKSDNKFEYWETWEKDENSSIIHFGIVGDKGETVILEKPFNERKDILKSELKKRVEEGYLPIAEDNFETIVIEYLVTENAHVDLEKRNKLESRLNEFLGWNGLGKCDGGSSGKNTLEVFCLVVDYDLAYKLITEDLTNSEFSDYSRIYQQAD